MKTQIDKFQSLTPEQQLIIERHELEIQRLESEIRQNGWMAGHAEGCRAKIQYYKNRIAQILA